MLCSPRIRQFAHALALTAGLAPLGLQAQDALAGATPVEVFLAGAPDTARVDTLAATPAAAAIRPPAILNRRDLAIVGGFGAAAVALFPVDRRVASWSQAPKQQENGGLSSAMAGAEWGVESGTLIAGAGLWATGLVTRNRTVADMGFHSLAAMLVSQQVTHVLKGSFGRARPYVHADSLSNDFRPGSGFGGTDRRSFPSGHTAQAFAFASAMSHEISHAWPRAGKVAAPLLYAGATAAGAARIYHDKHWVSDVVLGAAVGMVSARTTLRFLHGRPRNVFDRLALNTRIVPDGRGGMTVAMTVTR